MIAYGGEGFQEILHIFAGIFMTIVPALAILRAMAWSGVILLPLFVVTTFVFFR